VTHEFVEFMPNELADGTIYVSIPYATATHRCCCGCGTEIVTPLTPADWSLIFDGDSVSLYPSVGSSHLPCESHYWIRRDGVIWAPPLGLDAIEAGRESDRLAKAYYYSRSAAVPELRSTHGGPTTRKPRALARVLRHLRSRGRAQ
jgi:hypothetical protein